MPSKEPENLNVPLTKRDLLSITDTIREVADFILAEVKKSRRVQRRENKILETSIEDVQKQGETNTQSLSMLTKDLNKTKKLEFDIYNHEQRITKLEKVRP